MNKRKRRLRVQIFAGRRKIYRRFVCMAVSTAVFCADVSVSAMETGGFDINVGPGENWDYPLDWNQSSEWGDSQTGNGSIDNENIGNGSIDNGSLNNGIQNGGVNQEYGYGPNSWDTGNGNWQSGNWQEGNWQEGNWQNGTWQEGDWQSGAGYPDNGDTWYDWQNNTQGNNWYIEDQQGYPQTENQGSPSDTMGPSQDGYMNVPTKEASPTKAASLTPTPQPNSEQMPAPTRKLTPKPKATPTPKVSGKPTKTPRPSSSPKPSATLEPTQDLGDFMAFSDSLEGNGGEKSLTYYNKKNNFKTGQFPRKAKVDFRHGQTPEEGKPPAIQVECNTALQIFSLRVNGTECPWHWQGDSLIVDGTFGEKDYCVELLAVTEGGGMIFMEPWNF